MSAAVDVLVVGEALIDVVDRAGATVEHPGGSAANVALGLGRLGVGTALLTHIAPDARGRRIVEHLEASGLRVLDSSFTARRTSSAEIMKGIIERERRRIASVAISESGSPRITVR